MRSIDPMPFVQSAIPLVTLFVLRVIGALVIWVIVEILTFTPMGPVLAVRPYCNNAHYWQVYFDANRVIRETFGEAGFPAPEQHFAVRTGG